MIEIDKLCVGYENKKVIDNLSLNIKSGDYICVVGPNGAGKSTFVKALVGLKKEMSGKITLKKNLKRNEIGYLPQIKKIQDNFPASVYEIVLSGCLNKLSIKPFYSKKDKEKAIETLKKLNILNLKDKCYTELSGGQQQKVMLARALCASDKIIVLDEPVTGLDPTSTSDLYKKISELNKKDGLTVIMVTHDVETSLEYATHILNINGKNTFFSTISDYLHNNTCECVESEAFNDTNI